MDKIILVVLFAAILSGCGSTPVKLRTETVEVFKPILYCPAPDLQAISRPETLAYETITNDTSPGEVVKRYKASIIQLRDYISRLETSLMKYDSTNAAYEELRKQFIEQLEKDGFESEETTN